MHSISARLLIVKRSGRVFNVRRSFPAAEYCELAVVSHGSVTVCGKRRRFYCYVGFEMVQCLCKRAGRTRPRCGTDMMDIIGGTGLRRNELKAGLS